MMTSSAAEGVVYQIKASYIYNFLQFVRFSNSSISDQINVCIIGKNKFGQALNPLKGAETPQGEIAVTMFEYVTDPIQIASCQVVYVVGSDATFSQNVLDKINKEEVLSIGEFPAFIAMGGYIELFLENDSIHFRVNQKLVGHTQFKVAAQLLSLGALDR
jgi:hypothetical protein